MFTAVILLYTRRKIFSLQLDRERHTHRRRLIKLRLVRTRSARFCYVPDFEAQKAVLSDETGKIENQQLRTHKCNEQKLITLRLQLRISIEWINRNALSWVVSLSFTIWWLVFFLSLLNILQQMQTNVNHLICFWCRELNTWKSGYRNAIIKLRYWKGKVF